MKVYILMEVVRYQYGVPLGVYSSKEAAEAAEKAEKSKPDNYEYVEFHVEEHEVKDGIVESRGETFANCED